MTTAPAPATPEDLTNRLFEATIGALELFSVYLGEKLGLYRALAGNGPLTVAGLAAAAGIDPRYAREWLEQQATAGILAFDSAAASPAARTYHLPPGYDAVLLDSTNPLYIGAVGRFVTSIAGQAPALLNAYRTGGGVSWSQFGEDARTAQSDFNRPFFTTSLVPDYLANLPGLHDALSAPGARAAEIGFGGGWAMIALANAYPNLTVDGFDLDPASVTMASRNVSQAGLAGRVNPHERDAGDSALAGQYDFVAAYECIHDLPDPVSVLRSMRRLAKPGATILVMDEGVGEAFGNVGDPIERLFYGFSVSCCLPDGMAHTPTRATGTVFRPGLLRQYAEEAGYQDVEILPLEHDLFRFYRLVP